MGGGPDSDALKEHFAGTNTVLTGVMTGEALSQAFASADVFVMPSDTETLGFVVLESMASGVPVVGANAGGIPDLIEDGKVSRSMAYRDGGGGFAYCVICGILLGCSLALRRHATAPHLELHPRFWLQVIDM